MAESVFLTGGTGFIGRHLLERLGGQPAVRYLTRGRPGLTRSSGASAVIGDLREPATYAADLRGIDLVLHLGGVTGRARKKDHFAVTVDGTRALLAACRGAGVRRFVFVSSIAAIYEDKTAYHYAQSKQMAEQAVCDSGLNYLIVRPTVVLGPGSPIWSRLAALARLPVMPIPGDGSVRVQPIWVDDVATFLIATTTEPTLPDKAVDLGGPEIVTLEVLLRRIRRVLIGRDGPVIHVPVRGGMRLLAYAERWLPLVFPLTAGQLSAFINDSVACDVPEALRSSRLKSIDDMLHRMAALG